MMKRTVLLAAILAASVVSVGAQATPVSVNSFEAAKGTYQLAGLSWRCGKNNPAMWGTFGNGCLKQKRAWKNGRG